MAWGKRHTGEEIKRSPPKPTSFFFVAVLYSATWTYTLCSDSASIGHIYHPNFPSHGKYYEEHFCA